MAPLVAAIFDHDLTSARTHEQLECDWEELTRLLFLYGLIRILGTLPIATEATTIIIFP